MSDHIQNTNISKNTGFISYEDIIDIAINMCCKIRFSYINRKREISTRKIHPLVLFQYENFDGETHFFVTGYCELKSSYRTFRLDRISEMILINETFSTQLVDVDSLLGIRENGFPGFYMHRVKVLKCLNVLKPLPGTSSTFLDGKVYKVSVSGDKQVYPSLAHKKETNHSNECSWWSLLIFGVAVYLLYLLFIK